ncbi:MAG: CinA family protein [Anaerolineae bacterium]|nr:CinA family protein [Anaerolineae bacterium]
MELDQLAAQVGHTLKRRGLTLAIAESCTGGLLGHHLTNTPGSSSYFLGGVIAYSYSLKKRILGVPPETLVQFGAVSRQTALAMARGCHELTGAGVALAITGIAGPGGGMKEKPVGLVYVALVAEDLEACERHLWQGDRLENKSSSARAALLLLQRYLDADLIPIPEPEPADTEPSITS